ncbi:hypothetical protein A3I27_02120 [Candidatus Giovannonibacteria bacterium RIFCSPLOWO2_02_FULL_43_11b]|uniref:Rod shape-determining protein MreD n=1 Tax=Candidatus Giovannonibacteria bacterium RIFCSPHIGHO2_12_FULL_43_15 TaxID=1798341 RepID=A0A1F5WQ82_9BACT|nr:MAG: hypothetical protein A2739_02505 [Candidatus Giovannonibacteria bacterium RIFCSPHIGHO2_01_FULL_43_100]OGF67292.1 MAG: hypothetical protein A3B97_03215 [Candidatus Giovannonibacteria bacterium RIFCSPHIGHO2_02_FULL_43_32]OGF77780.1 MAG: hypothetical protein A3F23_04090 [Candidatus Giovannonibacteria bacterium RIFCSPHIGHO2_12_FULL_43_15]OGF78573.1 MAG: hypothetical protein A3A15_01275 [Candidatus Giovannonibacteria bacterium RIFCSPLOWO2_01_FULL_43_60]OGF90010.1 MAG: hypothetical protein A3
MSNLLIRFLLLVALLLAGFSFGWEFLLALFVFFIAIGKVYLEYVLVGFVFDVLFDFPFGFFTVIFSAILLAALLSDDFFKSDSVFNRAMRGIFASLLSVSLFFSFFSYSIWPDFGTAIETSAITFLKIVIVLAAMLLLSKLIETRLDENKIFK